MRAETLLCTVQTCEWQGTDLGRVTLLSSHGSDGPAVGIVATSFKWSKRNHVSSLACSAFRDV